MNTFEQSFHALQDQFLEDLATLVAIPSVLDTQTKSIGAPFGEQVAGAFDAFAKIAKRMGFIVENIDGYAIHACTSLSTPYIGVLAHLDVVDEFAANEWHTPPFTLTLQGDMLYGRGVNDDKGPLLAALYAMYLLQQEQAIHLPIRLIAGGAEETTWECVEHYFKQYPQPLMGFSPDGNFPIVNGEKGILQAYFSFPKQSESTFTIYCQNELNYVCDKLIMKETGTKHRVVQSETSEDTKQDDLVSYVYTGKTALSRNPQRGDNALWKWATDWQDAQDPQLKQLCSFIMEYLYNDHQGVNLGLFHHDEEMGDTSVCPMKIIEAKDRYDLYIDYRYVKGVDVAIVKQQLHQIAQRYNATFHLYKEKKCLYVDKESPLIQALQASYLEVMKEEAQVLTKGGASYARCLDVGVAFGATFENEDPKPHMPNEQMPLSSLRKASEIYYHALKKLTKGEDR